MAQGVRLQHLVAVSDGSVEGAVVAERGRRRYREVRVAVRDRWVVVTEYIVLQIRVAMSGWHWTWTRLVQG